ncbi:MAG: hypothetical protein P9L97_05150 [Candidatus Tenebribacter davisii]|nr:hypothetical protein [Candidatus Tenebribacter davisii]
MNYALRNSLILSILLVLVITGFIIGNTSSVSKIKKIKVSYDNNLKQLNELKAANPDMKDQDLFIKSLKDLEKKVQRESKLIPQKNDPTITYKYLLDISDNFCSDVKFNFIYNRLSKVENIGFYSFTIRGIAPIRSFYTFIYQIESQYMLYVIESIKINEEVEDDVSTGNVSFTLVLNAYFEESASEMNNIPFRKLKQKTINYDPFYSRIHAPIPIDNDQEFLDLNSSGMIGLTPNKVFMKDGIGRIHILELGDKVAYGTLESINWQEQYATFLLNEIGVAKNKKIYLNELKEESK